MNKLGLLCGLTIAAASSFAAPQNAAPAAASKPAASPTPAIAVYRWGAANPSGGAAANEAFAQWLNQPVVWGEDFTPTERWENCIEGGGWQLGEWSKWKKAVPGRRLIISIPLLPGGWNRGGIKGSDGKYNNPVSFEAGARGDYNEHFKNLAENLIKYGLEDSVIRLGWEFNGGWYTWRASDNIPGFIGYWRQIVTTMRAVPGAEKLQYCWNPAQGWLQFPAEQAWPGDEYVDIVGLDFYDQSWAKNTYPWPENATPEEIEARQRQAVDNVLIGGKEGLKQWSDFALKHNKPFALPEWGLCKRGDKHGGLDNPYFIEQVHKFINNPANHVAFHCYFDVEAGDGGHQLSPGFRGNAHESVFPKSAAKFKQLFSGTGAK
ncbi:MAG: glycosyl hydrolase [Chthoniobacteraceae bacterium]|nr:glycosyl hydrolase [Chthoniobacteraceae bacterium]